MKTVEYYLSLPYSVEVTPISEEEGGGFCACIPLLGCWSAVGDGETEAEAVQSLHEGLPSLFAIWLRDGAAIPEPARNDANRIALVTPPPALSPPLRSQRAFRARSDG